MQTASVLILNRQQVLRLLRPSECLALMDAAFRAVSDGGAVQPIRTRITPGSVPGALGIMPGFIDRPRALGIKVVTVFEGNFARGVPSHQGAVLLFDADEGALRGIFDAGAITAVRTAAASAVATRELARTQAQTLTILGYGEQAIRHVEAMLLVRPIRHVRIWGRSQTRAVEFAALVADLHGIDARAEQTVEAAVAGVDIICTTTAARTPVLRGASVPSGCHVNLVGSSFPDAREVDSALIARSRFFVDCRPMVEALGGEVHQAIEEGSITEGHIMGEIGEVLANRIRGRQTESDITVFKSVGLIAEDLAVAVHLYQLASGTQEAGTVTRVEF